MILVTGATGNTGSQVVHALRRRGVSVRAFVRDEERARARLGDGVDLALGDLADAASVARALEGVDALFLSCADDPRRVGWEAAAIDAARAAGVGRIVKLSTIGAAPGAPVAFWDWHGRVEEHVRESGVPAVVLRSSFSMSNLLAEAGRIAIDGRIVAPAGGARIAMIDPYDVGEAAASILTGGGEDGATYELTGPAALTYEDVARELSSVVGRSVEFVAVSDDDARSAMVAAGLPEFVADQVVAIFGQLRAGVASAVTGTVESLTGRPPRGIAHFLRDHEAAFGRGALATAT
jgi:uncharacterized protein YbjT (DUF2867 family)